MSKKEDIIQAGIRCFSDYGYAKTTMSDIGRIVGMNKASLYYHFKDKLSLYEAVVLHVRRSHLRTVQAEMDRLEDFQAKIIAFLTGEIDFSSNISGNYFSGDSETSKLETKSLFFRIVTEDIKIIQGLIDRGVERNVFAVTDSKWLAERLMLVAEGILEAKCPFYLPKAERVNMYQVVKKDITDIVSLILRGVRIDPS